MPDQGRSIYVELVLSQTDCFSRKNYYPIAILGKYVADGIDPVGADLSGRHPLYKTHLL